MRKEQRDEVTSAASRGEGDICQLPLTFDLSSENPIINSQGKNTDGFHQLIHLCIASLTTVLFVLFFSLSLLISLKAQVKICCLRSHQHGPQNLVGDSQRQKLESDDRRSVVWNCECKSQPEPFTPSRIHFYS